MQVNSYKKIIKSFVRVLYGFFLPRKGGLPHLRFFRQLPCPCVLWPPHHRFYPWAFNTFIFSSICFLLANNYISYLPFSMETAVCRDHLYYLASSFLLIFKCTPDKINKCNATSNCQLRMAFFQSLKRCTFPMSATKGIPDLCQLCRNCP